MKRFVLKKLFGESRCLSYKKFIIWILLLLVPGTQIVSFPVAYALTAPYSATSDVPSVPSFDPEINKEFTKNSLKDATGAAAKSAMASIFGIGENKAAAPSAYKNPDKVNDLVVLVVDLSLYTDPVSYAGLKNSYSGLSGSSLAQRIERYGEDIADNNKLTDVKILFFDKSKDTVLSLRDALENLYVNGEGLKNNRLAGVVLIGDVPMPVVNKKGNRFATIFPYTDFVDPVYTYDYGAGTFVKNDSIENPKAEVWHGVITAPYEGLSGREYLAQFFDKNHLYYTGEEDFSEFDKKMFFADLIREKERLNADVYPYYLRYLESLEDIAYFRFNKYWANELSQASMGSGDCSEGDCSMSIGEEAKEQGVLTGLGEILLGVDEGGNQATKDAVSVMPDIQTKNIIDTATKKYFQLLPKYISQLNDYIQYTGRYLSSDASHTPGLISIKDQYTQAYLKNVNTALEKAVNSVAGKLQEPIPVLISSNLSGNFKNPISVTVQIPDGLGGYIPKNYTFKDFVLATRPEHIAIETAKTIGTTLAIRYPYYNEASQKYYLNGIPLEVLESPKQCAPYLGSTKEEYFDEDLAFNPKQEDIVEGEYSILTRSIRSNNPSTARPINTIGINTRLLDPNISCLKTGGQKYDAGKQTCETNPTTSYSSGAIIEDNSDYGIPAFIENYLAGAANQYKNPFDGALKKGDFIVAINGLPISSARTLEQAIEKIYSNAEIEVNCLTYNPDTNECVERELANNGDSYSKVKNIIITYFRNGQKAIVTKSFKIAKYKKDGAYQILLFKGNNSHGAMFALRNSTIPYNMETEGDLGLGYADMGFDNAAGCLFMVDKTQSDKCFYRLMTTPLLDPAGSTDLKKDSTTNTLKFEEHFGSVDNPDDPDDHFGIFQYPAAYDYDEVDKLYLDYCYNGLPSIAVTESDLSKPIEKITDEFGNEINVVAEGGDMNRFKFPPDKNTVLGDIELVPNSSTSDGLDLEVDLYGLYADAVGKFINLFTEACADGQRTCGSGRIDMVAADVTLGTNQRDYRNRAPIIKNVFDDIKDANAYDIILNSERTFGTKTIPKVTLDMFTDHYGLFDGLDNNNDGTPDNYCLFGNHCEADTQYGLNPYNLPEIYRKFSSNIPEEGKDYELPQALLNAYYTGFEGTGGIVLHVDPQPFEVNGNPKEISSMILHNEPTAYTLMQQMKAMGTQSLPIDNPRYVAFQNTKGNVSKITYPNLFETTDLSQLQTNLSNLANQIAYLPGSYKILNLPAPPVPYPYADIKTEILNNYFLPVIQGNADIPSNGYDLTKADNLKVADAIDWLNMGIDEKYQYVLTNYLNPDKDAYAGDTDWGYESAYLVIEGQSDYFQMNFNKDLPEETDPNFNPLASELTPQEQQELQEQQAQQQSQSEGGDDGDDEEGPWIWEWLTAELYPFIEDIQNIGEFEDACVYSAEETGEDEATGGSGGGGMQGGGESDSERNLTSMKLAADKTEFLLNSTVNLTVEALDQNGNNLGKAANNKVVYLEIKQNSNNKVFSETDTEGRTFSNGFAQFNLKSLGVATEGTEIFAVCPSPICTPQLTSKITLKSAANTGSVTTYVIDQYSQEDVAPPEPVQENFPATDDEGVVATTGPGEAIPPSVPQPVPPVPEEDLPKEIKDPVLSAEAVNNVIELSWKNPPDNKDLVVGQMLYIDLGECNDFSQLAYLDSDVQKYTTEDLQPSEYCFKLTQKDKEGNESGGSTAKAKIETPKLNEPVAQDVFVPTESPAEPVKKTYKADDVGKIKILISDPVNKTTLYSTVIEDENKNLSEVTFETWEDYYNVTNYYKKFLEEPQTWEDYFVDVDYYKKFFDTPQVFRSSRLLAAVNIDVGISNTAPTTSTAVPVPVNRGSSVQLPDEKNPFIDALLNPYSKFLKMPSEEMVADGKSLMEIAAQIRNAAGDLDIGVNHTIEFKLVPIDEKASANTARASSTSPKPEEIPSFIKTPLVGTGVDNAIATTTTGEAKVYLKAGIKTGSYKIVAYLDKATDPLLEKEIYLVAGDPYYIEMKSDSSALVANGESRTQINFVVKDKYGNVCDNSFDQLGVFAKSESAYLDEKADLMKEIPGVQLRTVDGKANIDLISSTKPGKLNVIVVLIDYELEELLMKLKDSYDKIDFSKEIGTSRSFTVLDDAEISAEIVYPNPEKAYVQADNNSVVQIKTELLTKINGQYNRVATYNGQVNFKIINDQMLTFAASGKNTLTRFMSQGALHEANVKLKSKTVAGEAEILIEAPGFASKTIKVPVLAGPATKINLVASDEAVFTNGENVVTLKATVSDKYGNAIQNDNTTSVTFFTSDATKDLVQFIAPATVTVVDGVATTKLKGLNKTGTVNLTAKINPPPPPPGVQRIYIAPESGLLSLPLVSRITKEEVKEFAPKALYISLLGGSFGSFVEKDNIVQTLLYSGKTQAISSITASPSDSKRLFYLHPNGKFELLDKSLETKIIPTTNEFAFLRIILSDTSAKKELASMFVVPKTGTPLNFIDSATVSLNAENSSLNRSEQYTNEGIYLEKLSTADPKLTFNANSTRVSIFDEEGSEKFKVDKYGRVYIKDPNRVQIRLLNESDPEEIQTDHLSFVITFNGRDSALLTFNQTFGKDVYILPFKNPSTVFKSGVYIKYSSSLNKYGILPALSGSSTADPRGVYMVDTEISIDKNQAPGFSDTSSEDANTMEGVGFTGDNKNMLLFASGNSVGESNLPYTSEVGIVYGDPTIKLKLYKEDISNITQFTKDIGKSIFTSKKEIKNMIRFDYDSDGTDDVLLVYEDGLMRLLKNEVSTKGFIDKGFILNIYGGIFSMAKLDVNNDGFDDLAVGTKEPCIQGEECINLFTNNNGNFVRESLNLDIEGKLLDMKAADMNNDGCDDLVVSDTSGNIRVFYNQYEGGQCKGLNENYGYTKNFGFSMQGNQNLVNELFVYYPGVEKFDSIGYTNASKFIQFSLPSTSMPALPPSVDFKGNPISDPEHTAAVYAQAGKEFRTMSENNQEAAYKIIPQETYQRTYYFIHIAQDAAFKTGSSKYGVDVNGGVVELEDKIEYTITLRNRTGSDIRNLMLSTPLSSSLTLIDETPRCADSGCTDNLKWVDTGMAVRPKVITGISVPANGKRTIKYTMQIETMPVVRFELGRDLYQYPSGRGDAYIDIRVRPKANKDGIISHIYSTGVDSSGEVIYQVYEQNTKATLADDKAQILADKYDKYNLPDPTKLLELTKKMNTASFEKDENGLPKTDDSGNPIMDFLNNLDPPKMDDKDSGSGESKSHKSDTLGSKKNQQELEQQVSMMSQLLDSYIEDKDFDGVPDNLDYSLFNPSFKENIQPIREALITSCTVNYATSVFAGGGFDSDPSDGSMGFSGEYTPFADEAAAISDSIENAMNMLRCMGAGCLPIPYNVAFFAPDIIGIPPVPFGLPVFSTGSTPPWFAPMLPSPNWLEFRFYIIPTTTLGLVVSPCVMQGYGLCWPIAIPIASMTGCDKLVDAFLGAILALIDNVMADVESATGGAISGGTGGDQEPPEDLPGSTEYSLPADSPVDAAASFNIRIPGFPKVITDWIDQQTDEIYNKLLDFPDIYVIYPDIVKLVRDEKTGEISEVQPGTFITSNIEPLSQVFDKLKELGGKDFATTLGTMIQTPEDLLRIINAMPLIQIETKPVTIKIPMVSPRDWLRLKDEAAAWVKDWGGVKEQIEWYKEFYSCGDADGGGETICDKFILDITKLQKSIEKFMGDLETFLKLPRKIMEFRMALAKYAEQIVCYLDAIMKLFGAYVLKQIKIIAKWVQMVAEVIKMILSWKMILDLVIEFKVGCDECKNHRFSMLGLLLQLMIVIPTPPIIPLPKWPDLVFDFSQISTGVKIVWPEIKFAPEIIYPPHLPYFYIPKLFPELKLDIPGFFVEFPTFELPELPDLPPLPLPKLPDLPLPPKIPPLPDLIFQLALNLKPIFKILCLILKGLVPTFEWTLKTEAETLTQPNLNVVLAIIAKLSFSFPPITYDFVREIRATMQMSFSMDMDPVYTVVKSMTDAWNLNVRKLVQMANEATQFNLQGIIDKWLQEFYDALINALLGALGMCADNANPGAPGQETSFTLCIETATDEAGKQCEERANQGEIGTNYCNSVIGAQSSKFLKSMKTDENKAVLEPLIQKYDEMSASGAVQPSVLPPDYQYNGDDYIKIPGGGDYLDKQEIQQLKKSLSYAPYNELNDKLYELDDLINDYIAQMEEQNIPEMYYLAATQEILSPSDPRLNRPLAEIEESIAFEEIPDLPEFNQLKELRNGMIAYTKQLEDMDKIFDENSGGVEAIEKFIAEANAASDNLSKIIAKNNASIEIAPVQIASLKTPSPSSNKVTVVKGSFFGEKIEEQVNQVAEDSGLKIAASDSGMDQGAAYEGSSNSASLTSAPVGFFVTNPETGENENVLRYTPELSGATSAIFMDVDDDTDIDIVYSMGGDVYIKHNHKREPSLSKGEFLPVHIKNSISDYIAPGGSRVNGVTSPFVDTGRADISWLPKENVPAYEIILRRSLNDNMNTFVYRFTSETPSISVEIENGNYYATVYALNKDGKRSVASESTIVAPQPCADKEPPFPIVSPSEIDVPIFKTAFVDASNSFDANGIVTKYYLETLPYPSEKPITKIPKYIWSDLDLTVDSDGDGLPVNDKDNPVFAIGPFVNEGDIGTHKFLLHVADQSGNEATQEITVNVFVPDITLNQTVSKTGIALGKTNPSVSEMPFALIKQSYLYRVIDQELKLIPYLSKIITASAHKDKKYYTDKSGEYEIDDLNLFDMILVRNSADEVVAEINPQTANVGIVKQGYKTETNKANPPLNPTHIEIIKVNMTARNLDESLAKIFVIADPNIDAKIYQNFIFDAQSIKNLWGGVHVSDTNSEDEFVLVNIPLSDPNYPGGVAVINKTLQKQVAAIDTSGNIIIIDPKITIKKKNNNHVIDPVIIEMLYEDRLIAEIYISALQAGEKAIIVGPNDIPYQTPRAPSVKSLYTGVSGIDFKKEVQDMIYDFFKRGIFESLFGTGFGFDQQQLIKRSEFVKVVLDMLCIIPRKPDAYLPYSKDEAGGGFSDIKYDAANLAWYYPYVKEGALLGLVQGYLGETDKNGLHPFKPDNTISRAEAVKIILEALEYKGIIDLSSINIDITIEGWYWQYMEAAKDLIPYLKEPLKNNFILTSEEGDKPEELMTYEQLFTMANRVLDVYNCFEEDKDNDGMSDFCEVKYGVDDPEADQDNDGLNNAAECAYGTDPTIPDSDGGGVNDGDEFKYGSDMLEPTDDPMDTDGDGLTDMAEKLIYKTDPNDPDTDKGGVTDGMEVLQNLTDPLDKTDDATVNEPSEGEEGVYIVPEECNTCPCPATLLHKADIVNGDMLFSVISNYTETQIFSKSNEVIIESLSSINYEDLIKANVGN